MSFDGVDILTINNNGHEIWEEVFHVKIVTWDVIKVNETLTQVLENPEWHWIEPMVPNIFLKLYNCEIQIPKLPKNSPPIIWSSIVTNRTEKYNLTSLFIDNLELCGIRYTIEYHYGELKN